MSERAFFFRNRLHSNLFGYQHIPSKKANTGVVFCPPFGEEKYRSYRVLVNYSRFLADKGVPSFRFDVKGSGDSDGDMLDTTVDSQVADTLDAISLFCEQQNLDQIVLIGLRFGAIIAALAADQDARVKALVLLSPIVNGSVYWRELLRTKQLAAVSLNQKAEKSSELMKELETSGKMELEAQYISREFVNQLQSIDLSNHSPNFSSDLLICDLENDIINRELSPRLLESYKHSNCRVELFNEEKRDYWSNLSLYEQFCPDVTMQYSHQWLVDRGLLDRRCQQQA